MGFQNRPYVGTFTPNARALVQHTPDAIVRINGSLFLPGCPSCNGKIDIQEFLTEVGVDAGVEAGSASASFSLSIPIHHYDSIAHDSHFILRPGLEVEIAYRGYFPVKGLYAGLNDPQGGNIQAAVLTVPPPPKKMATPPATIGVGGSAATKYPVGLDEYDFTKVPPELIAKWGKGRGFSDTDHLTEEQRKRTILAYGSAEVIERYWQQQFPGAQVRVITDISGHSDNHLSGAAIDFIVEYEENGEKKILPALQTYGGISALTENGAKLPRGGFGTYLNVNQDTSDPTRVNGTGINDQGVPLHGSRAPGSVSATHYDYRGAGGYRPGGSGGLWIRVSTTGVTDSTQIRSDGAGGKKRVYDYLTSQGLEDVAKYVDPTTQGWKDDPNVPPAGDNIPNWLQVLGQEEGFREVAAPPPVEVPEEATEAPTDGPALPPTMAGESLLKELGLDGLDVENVLNYPYYKTFHGVVTSVSHSLGGGVRTISVTCSSLLHFWSYHNISEQAALLSVGPSNGKNSVSEVGSNFNGMHPYEIIYSLYSDMGGAASGTSFVHTDKNNQNAIDSVTGQNLFSVNIKYWEQRFNTQFQRLRLHAVNGDLFSAAQAAFLGRLSRGNLLGLMRGRFSDANTSQGKSQDGKRIFSTAKTLGLFNNNRLGSLAYLDRTTGKKEGAPESEQTSGNSGLELNLPEMQAFVQDVGGYANISTFESSYQTKMDLAQSVTELTGFEFYQDVDGDLVFKPPFYNMDTSASRPYRIEDIDLISVSQSSTEPTATYITIKGAFLEDLSGTGVDNEWGVRGQYIDYRLVAQFGWRASNMDCHYFTDNSSAYFAAVNRLDLINIGMNTASVSIPLRPEIRPGYPIYIPSLDVFYYVQGLSHQFSYGGQCSTTLNLVGRREKFFAPGDPSKRGIDSIDLGNLSLPARPLEVMTPNGPRLQGFPNVVMAMDPYKVNPRYIPLNADYKKLESPESVNALLQLANQLGLVQRTFLDPATRDPDQVVYTMQVPDSQGQVREVSFSSGNVAGAVNIADAAKSLKKPDPVVSTVTATQPISAYDAEIAERISQRDQIEVSLREIDPQEDRLSYLLALKEKLALEHFIYGYPESSQVLGDGDFINPETPELGLNIPVDLVGGATGQDLLKRVDALRRGLVGERDKILTDREASSTAAAAANDPSIQALRDLVDKVAERYQTDHPDYKDANSTLVLLEMLSNKKASLNLSIPGEFRYYSSSSPRPADQGAPTVDFVGEENGKGGMQIKTASLDGKWAGYTNTGFLPSSSAYSLPGERKGEAQLGDVQVQNGIRVLTSNPNDGPGQVRPTAEIRTLMFANSIVDPKAERNNSFRNSKSFSLGTKLSAKLLESFTPTTAPTDLSPTVVDVFLPLWNQFAESVSFARGDAYSTASDFRPGISPGAFPSFPSPAFPQEIVLKGLRVPTDRSLERLYFEVLSSIPSEAGVTPLRLVQLLGAALSAAFVSTLSDSRLQFVLGLKPLAFSEKQVSSIIDAVNSSLSDFFGVAVESQVGGWQKGESKSTFAVQTPVFPVSDAQGYVVVGSYQYGRGVTTDPDGVLSALHRQDPFSFLSREAIDSMVEILSSGQSGNVTITIPDANGVSKKVTLPVAEAVNRVNELQLQQFRTNLTDQDILDLGLATRNSDNPDLIEYSFLNWFEDGQKEGVNKVPILNAAWSLADIRGSTGTRVCECKAAEARVLLSALRADEVVPLVPTSFINGQVFAADRDNINSFLANQASLRVPSWLETRRAVQGTVLDRGGPSILQTLGNAVSDLGNATSNVRDAVNTLNTTANSLGEE